MKLEKSLQKMEEIADELNLSKSKKGGEIKAEDISDLEEEEKVTEPVKVKVKVKANKKKDEDDYEDDDYEDDDDDDDDEDYEDDEDEDDEDNEDDEDDEDEDLEKCKGKRGLKKSVETTFAGSKDLQKGVEVSDFLAAVVEATSESVALLAERLEKSMNGNDKIMATLVKSFGAISQSQKAITQHQSSLKSLVKSIVTKMEELEEQVFEMGAQPTMRKSARNIKMIDKDYNRSTGGGGESLSKSQVLSKLSDMIESGAPGVTIQDIISYESGAPLRPELAHKIHGK